METYSFILCEHGFLGFILCIFAFFAFLHLSLAGDVGRLLYAVSVLEQFSVIYPRHVATDRTNIEGLK